MPLTNAIRRELKRSHKEAEEELRARIRVHGPEMINLLLVLARTAVDERVRVVAIRELLDRGYGKQAQIVQSDVGEGGPVTGLQITFVAPTAVDDGDVVDG